MISGLYKESPNDGSIPLIYVSQNYGLFASTKCIYYITLNRICYASTGSSPHKYTDVLVSLNHVDMQSKES